MFCIFCLQKKGENLEHNSIFFQEILLGEPVLGNVLRHKGFLPLSFPTDIKNFNVDTPLKSFFKR